MTVAQTREAKWAPRGAWNLLILLLSAYVIFALIFSYIRPENPHLTQYLRWGDTICCVFFLIDVFIRFMAAPNRISFWKYGWVDLVTSIPNIAPLRYGRIFSILRILRILRAIRASMRISEYFFENRMKSAFATIAATLILTMSICGAMVLAFESQNPESKIQDAFDALWWTTNTITTVGSSDTFPLTDEGRIIGMFLMFIGIGMFSALSALTVAWYLNSSNSENFKSNKFNQKFKKNHRKDIPCIQFSNKIKKEVATQNNVTKKDFKHQNFDKKKNVQKNNTSKNQKTF